MADTIPGDSSTTFFLPIGGSETSDIDFGGDADWFQVDVELGTVYWFDLRGSGRNGGTLPFPELTLYFPNATDEANFWDSNTLNDYSASHTGIEFFTAGTYYLAVEAQGGASTGSYTLTASLSNDNIADDTNTGSVLNPGESRTGDIEYEGDVDWLRMQLSTDRQYTFDLRGTASGGGTLVDPFLELYDVNGVFITEAADTGGGTDSQLLFLPPSAGIYYIAAQGFDFDDVGSYTLDRNSILIHDFIDEVNVVDAGNTLELASSATANSLVDGYINPETDIDDYYRIIAPNSGTLTVAIEQSSGHPEDLPHFDLLDAEGNIISAFVYDVDSIDVVFGDTYYLRVDTEDGILELTGYALDIALPITEVPDDNVDALPVGDAGDSRLTATIATTASVIDGHIAAGVDNDDYYRLVAPEDGLLTLTIAQSSGDLEDLPHFDFLDADGNFLRSLVYETASIQVDAGASYFVRVDTDQDILGLVGYSLDLSLVADTGLEGSPGDDVLDLTGPGGGQAFGGDGNDTFIVDDPEDEPIELFGEGIDTVQASLSWMLGPNLENLVLTGGEAIDGFGNELDNVLEGNAAANVLDGELGADEMRGGLGADTYYVDNVFDQVIETGNVILPGARGLGIMRWRDGELFPVIGDLDVADDIDQVISTISYTLVEFTENLSLVGLDDIDGGGNDLDNTVVGNSGRNVLNSGVSGEDQLMGGGGDDVYIVSNRFGTTRIEDQDGGTDVLELEQFSLSGDKSELVFQDTAAESLLIRNAGSGMVEVSGFFAAHRPIGFLDVGSGPVNVSAASDADELAALFVEPVDPLSLLVDGEPYYQSRVLIADGSMIEGEMAQIFRQYLGGLGRQPAAGGYQFWWDRIEDGRLTFNKAAQQFIDSPEFNAKADTSGDSIISNEEFVDHMYFNVFGRAPAEGGRNFWLNSIDRSSQAVAFTNMLQSPEFVQKTVITISDWPYWDEIA